MQRLGYCLIEKYETFRIKIGNVFCFVLFCFFERNISSVSQLNKFYSKKEKNVKCECLLSDVIVYIYSLGKRFYCTYLKTTDHEMILSFAKPFKEKMHEQIINIWKKIKKIWVFFHHFQLWDEHKVKRQICFVGIKMLNNSQNVTDLNNRPNESVYPKCHVVFLVNWKTKFKNLWLDFVFTLIWNTKFKWLICIFILKKIFTLNF